MAPRSEEELQVVFLRLRYRNQYENQIPCPLSDLPLDVSACAYSRTASSIMGRLATDRLHTNVNVYVPVYAGSP